MKDKDKQKHILGTMLSEDYEKRKQEMKNMKEIIEEEQVTTNDDEYVERKEKFYMYFVYSNKRNKMLGTMYLTENQAYQLNQFMRCQGVYEQDIAFLKR
jgi:vacuolar-type H+-ATPase subunit B/Vma2